MASFSGGCREIDVSAFLVLLSMIPVRIPVSLEALVSGARMNHLENLLIGQLLCHEKIPPATVLSEVTEGLAVTSTNCLPP